MYVLCQSKPRGAGKDFTTPTQEYKVAKLLAIVASETASPDTFGNFVSSFPISDLVVRLDHTMVDGRR